MTGAAPTLLDMVPGDVAALVVTPSGRGEQYAALLHGGTCRTAPLADVVAMAASLEREASPRWVWWSAEDAAAPLVEARIPLARAWDVAEAHRLLHGGWSAAPASAGRRRTASPSRTCRLRRRMTSSGSPAATTRRRTVTPCSTSGVTCGVTTVSG